VKSRRIGFSSACFGSFEIRFDMFQKSVRFLHGSSSRVLILRGTLPDNNPEFEAGQVPA